MKKIWISIFLILSLVLSAYSPKQYETLELHAKAAVLMDAETGRILYEKNGFEAYPNASTTKIMTCILALENGDDDLVVTVSKNAAIQPKVKMNLKEGEEYRLGDLLYSLMLESHNDTAVAIAETLGGNLENFSKMMNEKAEEIGCENTHFITPNGLDAKDEEGIHSTSASDLALITSYALKNQGFRELIETKSKTIMNISQSRSFTLTNKNSFLDMYEGAVGVKTGYTSGAGYCFVGAVDYEGGTLVSVCLGSGWPPNKNWKWEDARKLMNYGEKFYGRKEQFIEEKTVGALVEDGVESQIEIMVPKFQYSCLMGEDETVREEIQIIPNLKAPIDEKSKVGYVTYSVNGFEIKKIDLYAKTCVEERTYKYYKKQIFDSFLFFTKKK